MSAWSPRFLPLVEKYKSRRVFDVGTRTIGWPPTIDVAAGRVWIKIDEFNQIRAALEASEVAEKEGVVT